MLEYFRGEAADRVVVDLLAGATGQDAADLLRAATRRAVDVPVDELTRLPDDPVALGPAIDATGVS